MADLPESIMREARRIEAEWSRNGRSISTRDTLIDSIARALRARDERAARIVAKHPGVAFESFGWMKWRLPTQEEIATAILSDDEGGGNG